MDQLLLAVLKANMRRLKGRLFSRYGPAQTEMVGLPRCIDPHPSAIIKVAVRPPATADAATLSNALSLLFNTLPYETPTACWHRPVKIGRKFVQRLTALFRTPEFNALAIPLQQEGVC